MSKTLSLVADAKYNSRPARFSAEVSSTLLSMANPKSGAVKTDWIVEVYEI